MTLLYAIAILATAIVGVVYAVDTYRHESDKVGAAFIGIPCLLFGAAALQTMVERLS